MRQTKKCSGCKEVKETSEFHKDATAKDGLRSQCKDCRKVYSQSPKWKAYDKGRRLKEYGLSIETWSVLLLKQKNRSGCCGDKFQAESGINGPCVHHNHTTGRVAGLWCSKCNAAEGLLGTPERAFKLYKKMKEEALKVP